MDYWGLWHDLTGIWVRARQAACVYSDMLCGNNPYMELAENAETFAREIYDRELYDPSEVFCVATKSK